VRTRATAVVAGLLALTLAGCGGGGGGGRLSRDAYVTKADAICASYVKQRARLPAPTSIEAVPAYADGALPLLDAGLKDLRRLRPPAEMEDGVSAWLKALGDGRNALDDLRTAAKAGDNTKARELGSKAAQIHSHVAALAGSLGLTACANA
jgi:hypothetical protein